MWIIVRMETKDIPYLTSLSQRFALIVAALCAVVGGCVARRRAGLDRYYLDPAIVPLIDPIWHWLNNSRKRVEKLLAKLATGWRPVVAKPRAQKKVDVARAKPVTGVRLPRRFGWRVGLSQETGAYGEQLQKLLSEPETVALVAEVSTLRRLLRPLCNALAWQPGPPLGKIVVPVKPGPVVPRDKNGRFRRPMGPWRGTAKHWIEPYPGTDIRFLVE